ncbi:MAG: tRNA (adenosine(37)-N6)-threonylcarbamoyltransferase complex ATPase subunit type 1 TsaE [Pseudomonadota bacterium]
MRSAVLPDDDFRALSLSSEVETARFGRSLGQFLRAGDWISLIGPLGVGKTALARSLVQGRLGQSVEVPSPSYTLVNVYDGEPQIWHADLYRLGEPEEAHELGLLDDLADRIVLVEWPERLDRAIPDRRLEITLGFEGDQGRFLRLAAYGDWDLEGLV